MLNSNLTTSSTLQRLRAKSRHASGFIRNTAALTAVAATVTMAAGATTLLLDSLKTSYEPAMAFQVSYATETNSEQTKMEMIRDGEPVDRGGRGGRGGRTQTFEMTYIDTIQEAKDGAPTKIERMFDTVGGETVMEARDDMIERSLESEFEGLTIVLTEGDDGVEVEVTDGEAPDAERLDGHTLALPLDGLLPEDDVEVGAEWEIESDAFLAALGMPLQRKLIDRPERPERGGERGGRGGGGRRGGQRGGNGGGGNVLGQGDWTITATLSDETREVNGLDCAVIKIEAEVEGALEDTGGREGRQSDRTIEGEFSGEFLFCMSASRPVSLEIEGSYEVATEMSFESERGSMEISRAEETDMTIAVTVEPVKAEESDD